MTGKENSKIAVLGTGLDKSSSEDFFLACSKGGLLWEGHWCGKWRENNLKLANKGIGE